MAFCHSREVGIAVCIPAFPSPILLIRQLFSLLEELAYWRDGPQYDRRGACADSIVNTLLFPVEVSLSAANGTPRGREHATESGSTVAIGS